MPNASKYGSNPRLARVNGFVYIIACQAMEAVKIGFTKAHPQARLSSLRTGCPRPLELVCYFPGSMEDERALHDTFAPLALEGEWFQSIHKLRDFVWYLTYDDKGNPLPRRMFEDALWDTVITGYCYPDKSDPAAYETSADTHIWAGFFGEELAS